ncbi:helical backbone metal receptor [Streptomyces sp. NPDC048565]|uniref:helical backbone metal receptor n=1 Tax=Streptomyces sp. NPDC048565 TaxID=3155266 RepID=UPI003424DFDF
MRVVSLVPSLTEAVAVTAPGLLVGVTDWCTRPAGLTAARIGGTKNPDTAGDGPEAFPDLAVALVDGRHLTWYGPSLAEAAGALRAALR